MVKEDESDEIAGIHLHWIIDLCNLRKFPLDNLNRRLGLDLTSMLGNNQTLTWQAFADLFATLCMFFDDQDFQENGRRSWQLEPFKAYADVGRVLFSTIDQYIEIYGPVGYVARHFPIKSQFTQTQTNHLQIRLTMKHGLAPSPAFFSLLAGQMQALPKIMEWRCAEVILHTEEKGACFQIKLPGRIPLISSTLRLVHWLGASRMIARDFNALKQTHENLQKQYAIAASAQDETSKTVAAYEKNYRLLSTNVQNVVWTMNARFKIGVVTPTIETVLGYSEDEFKALGLNCILAAEDLSSIIQRCKDLLRSRTDTGTTLDLRCTGASGQHCWMEIKILLHDRPGTLICIARDISQLIQLKTQLATLTEHQKQITRSVTDGIIMFGRDYIISDVNPAAGQVFGYRPEELQGLNLREVLPETLAGGRLREFYRSFKSPGFTLPLQGLTRDKALVPLEVSLATSTNPGAILGTCVFRDLSGSRAIEQEREVLQKQLEEDQKMAAVGQLSSGVTHDFRNLLVAILGYADLALETTHDKRTVNFLSEIRRAGKRGTDMTQKLLGFSRKSKSEWSVFRSDQLFKGIEDILARLLPHDIELNFSSHATGVRLYADINQLEQVIVNLAINARDAMPRGGQLAISSSLVKRSDATDELAVEVSDSGSGMDPDVQKRIFEPLFTTKSSDQGTGLGLAIVFDIVNQHGGSIEVASEIGQGTTFTVYLPVTKQLPAARHKVETARPAGGNETILVIEDDEQVRSLTRLILLGAGYRVLTAADGEAGVNLFLQNKKTIDLALIDVILPKIGGLEIVRALQQVNTHVKFILTTAYSRQYLDDRFLVDPELPLIFKPYGINQLRQQVRLILDGEGPGHRQDDSSATFG